MKRYIIIALALVSVMACCVVFAQKLVPVPLNLPHEQVNVVALGDSNTWLGKDDCSCDKAWTKWFVDAFKPATCISYARSGATWTNTATTELNTTEDIAVLGNDNVIYNQVMRLIEAYDSGEQPEPHLILIAAGVNDAWFVKKRPMAFNITPAQAQRNRWSLMKHKPSEVLTLAESVVYNCQLLHNRFPQARIVLVTPCQATVVSTQMVTQASAVIDAAGQSMGLYSVRLDMLSPVNRVREKRAFTYTADGAHTNAKGAKANGEIIANSMKMFYK